MRRSKVPVPIFFLIAAVVLVATWNLLDLLPIEGDVKLIVDMVVIGCELYYLTYFFKL